MCHSYTKNLSITHLKLKLKWPSCILYSLNLATPSQLQFSLRGWGVCAGEGDCGSPSASGFPGVHLSAGSLQPLTFQGSISLLGPFAPTPNPRSPCGWGSFRGGSRRSPHLATHIWSTGIRQLSLWDRAALAQRHPDCSDQS